MGRRGLLFVAATVACLAAPLSSCLDATEIMLELSTDVACATASKNQVVVRIGSPDNIEGNPPTRIEFAADCSDATASSSTDLGTIAVVPSSSGFDSIVSISVAVSDDITVPTSTCFPEDKGGTSCIYAHRQISFLPHERVTLPIVLSSVCAGVTCVAPLTCGPDGKCSDGTVDPNDCGSSCSTGEDASPIPDAHADVPIFVKDVIVDVPLDVLQCTNGTTACGNTCVDLQKNEQNCGACGLDCSGGTCNAGTCALNTSIVGTCLAVLSAKVFVATNGGPFIVPTSGGTAMLYGTDTSPVTAMASTSLDVAWFALTPNGPYFNDLTTVKNEFVDPATKVTRMALNGTTAAWFDEGTTEIYHLALTSISAPVGDLMLPQATNPVPIAMGATYRYVAVPAQNVIWYTDGTNSTPVQATGVGAIVVDVPSSLTPNVYDVEGRSSTTVYKRDYTLQSPTLFATSKSQINALAWDGTTLVANEVDKISIAQGNAFTPIVSATPAPSCVAVDATAVYWVDAKSGLYKHAKP